MTRFGYVMTTSFAVTAVGVLSYLPVAPKLIWNASASVPLGLYSIAPARHLKVTDLVAVETPLQLVRPLKILFIDVHHGTFRVEALGAMGTR